MNLLNLMVRIGAQDEASGKIERITSGTIAKATAMGNALYDVTKNVAKFAFNGVKSVAEGAVNGFRSYEQLAGGVEKIFDTANIKGIMDDANSAFLDLNMSANQYMAAINQTGAAFAQTMGDQKGYDTARTGMKAIADYASGTGRNVDELNTKFAMITRATSSYQSIADQFSGILPATSKDFLEQAKAAGILSDNYEQLTDVPIAEYQEAVSKMLEKGVKDMGLYGNTADESLKTIDGSINMARSAWDNLLTSIGSGDSDRLNQAINGLITAIFGTWSDATQKKEGGLINNLLPVVQNVGNAILQQIPAVGERIGFQLVQSVMQAMGFDNAEITTFVEDLSAKFEDAKTKITNVFSEVKTAVTDFFSSFTDTADTGYLTVAMQKIQDIASQVWGFVEENILPHADEIGEFLGNVANFLMDVATTALTVVSNLGPVIPMIASALGFVALLAPLGSIIGAISGAVTFFTTVLMPALSMIQSVSGLIAVVTTLLGGPLTIIVAIAGALIGLIATNEDARAAIAAAWEAIRAKGEELLAWFQTLPDTISGFFSGLGDILAEAGRNIIGGLLSGLKEKFEDVKNWVGGIGDWIASHKGPKPYDLKLLTPNGEWIMDSLQRGLENGLPSVQDTLSDITDSIQTGVNASANVSVAQAPSGDAAILNALNAILNAIPDGVYLDKKTLVGNLAPSMNVAMGRL